MFGLFRKPEKVESKTNEIRQLELDVSRERTKLFGSLAVLDTVSKSDDFEFMVQRSLKLMEPKK